MFLQKLKKAWFLMLQATDVIRYRTWAKVSYSQEGEDILLDRFLGHITTGFYVDVGAHDPKRFSNTYHFYRKGWRGITIEPNLEAARRFRALRPRDIHLVAGVGVEKATLKYYEFNEPALNSFDAELAQRRTDGLGSPYRILRVRELEVLPLSQLLAPHLDAGQTIDLLSIDVEGKDLEVLQSNDWNRFRPYLIVVESISEALKERPAETQVHAFLQSQGYRLQSHLYLSSIYRDSTR